MGHGMITKVAVTPANIPDGRAIGLVLQRGGMVFADKGYCTTPAQQAIRAHGCHSGAIKKINMHGKNKDLGRWLTSVR